MKGFGYIISIILMIYMFIPEQALSEYIYLKDGQVLNGDIIDEDRLTITVRTSHRTKKISRKEIVRIMYGQREMEPIHMLLKDGRMINGYLVDQDSRMVIIRRDKDRAVEETIIKSKIQQISGEEIKLLFPDITLTMGIYLPFNSGSTNLGAAPIYIISSGINFTPVRKSRIFLEAGYSKSRGKSNENLYFQFIPITINAAYEISIPFINIVPRLGAGIALVEFNNGEGEKFRGFDFDASAGLGFLYGIFKSTFSVGLWIDYNLLVEGKSNMSSIIARAGLNYRF